MEEPKAFWPPFWTANAMLTFNWLVAWSGATFIPHRVTIFFLILPALESIGLIYYGLLIPKHRAGTLSAVAIHFVAFFPQMVMLSLYAGLGDNASFFH